MVPLLQAKDLSKRYGGKTIFSGLSFSVFARQKIGIIGRNGAGKSTLFRMILGQEEGDSGEIIISPEARLGSIRQEADFLPQESALSYLERQSGREDWRCRQVASRFRFSPAELGQAAASLSGGWQMRLKLSAMLLAEPNLFLLDEPTNYLDLGTLLLLEDFLRSYPGGFLIISHDREFLKNTCQQTMEITPRRCISFPQPLEAYLAYKEQRLQSESRLNEKIEREQKNMQAFVDRFRYKASKAAQAQSFLKKIEKLEKHRVSIEHNAGTVHIQIPFIEKRRNRLLSVDQMSIGHDGKVLVSEIDFQLRGSDKLILVGDNGQGKTTLIKTLMGQIPPVSGAYTWFSGLKISYFDQLSSSKLKAEEQVGDYLNRISDPGLKTEKVLQMAGDFLFSGEDLKKPLGALSGGEKSRLILAGLLLSKPDILILDEPNNHLDFETVEALGQALRGYLGAVIFTSHDRTFANLVATQVLELRDGRALSRYQDYEDYLARLESRILGNEEAIELRVSSKEDNAAAYRRDKESQKQLRLLERTIEKLEKEKESIFRYFLEHPLEADMEKKKRLVQITEQLASLEEEWLQSA